MKSNRRIRWKILTLLAAALGIATITIGLLLGMRQKRIAFIGYADPASGIRCRFTLAVDWSRKDNIAGHDVPGYLQIDTFTAPTPGRAKRWIDTHLFRRSTVPIRPPTIFLVSPRANVLSHYLRIQRGYPELLPPGGPTPGLQLKQRHLRINGYPATVITTSTRSESGVALLVYVPEYALSYVVSGTAEAPDAAQIEHEMEAIISSFHIEKVLVSSPNKP